MHHSERILLYLANASTSSFPRPPSSLIFCTVNTFLFFFLHFRRVAMTMLQIMGVEATTAGGARMMTTTVVVGGARMTGGEMMMMMPPRQRNQLTRQRRQRAETLAAAVVMVDGASPRLPDRPPKRPPRLRQETRPTTASLAAVRQSHVLVVSSWGRRRLVVVLVESRRVEVSVV